MSEQQKDSDDLVIASTEALSMTPATALPWELRLFKLQRLCAIEPNIADAVLAQDGAYIVRACNAYPKLVAALIQVRDFEAMSFDDYAAKYGTSSGAPIEDFLRELGELDVVVGNAQDVSPPNSKPAVAAPAQQEEGYVRVPREPTEAMIAAAMPVAFIGHPEASEESKARWFMSRRLSLIEKYRAMLAAVRKPE